MDDHTRVIMKACFVWYSGSSYSRIDCSRLYYLRQQVALRIMKSFAEAVIVVLCSIRKVHHLSADSKYLYCSQCFRITMSRFVVAAEAV